MASHDITITFRVTLSDEGIDPASGRTRALNLLDFYLRPVDGDSRIERVVPGPPKPVLLHRVPTGELHVGDVLHWSGVDVTVTSVRAAPGGFEVRVRDGKGVEHVGFPSGAGRWEVRRG